MTNYYLVAYDLNQIGQDYPKIEHFLRSFGKCQKILRTTWIIRSADTVESLLAQLKNHIDKNDEVFVTKLDYDTAWKFNEKQKDDAMKAILDSILWG